MDDGVVSNEVIKRRLPPWMLGVAAADKCRPGDSNNYNNNPNIGDGCGSSEDEQRVKKRGGRRQKSKVAQKKGDDFSDGLELEGEEKKESSAPVVKCGERKRTRRKVYLDGEVATKKKKQRGRAKRSTQTESSADAITGDCLENGEDEDLTVEDLMILAKEYVVEDVSAQEVDSMKGEISDENQSGDVVQSGNPINAHQEKTRSSEGREMCPSDLRTENVNVTNEGSVFKPSMSGDPTQDMLDLFLGPLLKKIPEKEKKVELTSEEMDFNFKIQRQNTSTAPEEEPATITVAKKKSSLRDRVAMFLD